jgi:hypothetical protein
MPSNYSRIREENIKEYGEGTRHLAFLGQLYTEQTHFIFELIQNAEDAGATRMCFRLCNHRLEVEHNGRLFDEPDVRGVCGVGEGTKSNDLTKIGKFGIGFKSIYAYTTCPEIHSGEEHFRIEHYVRPESFEAREPNAGFTTLFIFPFFNPEEAFQEIQQAFRKLSPQTVLFLRNIEFLGIACDGDEPREISRVRGQNNPAEVLVKATGKKDEEWLIFERPVALNENTCGRVEIAFSCSIYEKKRAIVPLTNSPLVVFFPTEKSTNLGFLLQGPYRTTPARDNVPKDDATNRFLIQETASLLVETLEWFRDHDLLTVEVLQTLPIDPSRFPEDSLFRPIFNAVRDALLNKPLLPAYRENDEQSSALLTFTSGREAKLAGSGELRKLLSGKQLADLYGTPGNLSWISGDMTADRTPTLWEYLRKELKIDELNAKAFVDRIDENFLTKQTDEWLVSFYEFLQGQQAWFNNLKKRRESKQTWPEVPFFKKPIIRLDNGRHIAPFSDEYGQVPAAFLPGAEKSSLPTIKATIAEKKEAREFLKALGFDVPDIVDVVIERILPKYASSTPEIPPSYQADFGAILDALKTDSEAKKKRLREKLGRASWVLAENATNGKKTLRKPGEVYFRSQELEMYFIGNSSTWFLGRELDEFKNALEEPGVSKFVRVSHQIPDRSGNVSIPSKRSSWYTRGLKGFDPDTEIDGLDFALTNPTVEKSRFIWKLLLLPHKHLLKGIVETATRQDYDPSTKEEKLSEAGRIASKHAWLPSPKGEFCKPSELGLDELPEGFERDEELAKGLGMKLPFTAATVRALAEAVGVDMDELDYLKNNRDEFQEFRRWNESQRQRANNSPAFPSRPVGNPERREEKVVEQLENAPDKMYEKKDRSVRTSTGNIEPDVWLRSQYTDDTGQMRCQICQKKMPFRKRNGEYYFEAVEAFSKDHCTKEHEAQFLALCPLCAAMYKEFVKRDEGAMLRFKHALLSTRNLQISLQLGEQTASLRFVETHLYDLRLILRKLSPDNIPDNISEMG